MFQQKKEQKTDNQQEISKIVEAKLPKVEDWEAAYGQASARRDKKRNREVINEKIGGTLAGQQQKMRVSRGYQRVSRQRQRDKVKVVSKAK